MSGGYHHKWGRYGDSAKGGGKAQTSTWTPRRDPGDGRLGQVLSELEWHNTMLWQKEEAEKKKEEERKLREAREVELGERKKDREEMRLTMKEHNSTISGLVQNMTSIMKSWGRRPAPEDEGDGNDAPPAKRPRARSSKETHDPHDGDGDDGDSGDWRSALQASRGSAPRRQNVAPPINADEWSDWTCSRAEAKSLITKLNLKLEQKALVGKMIDECVDACVKEKTIDQWKTLYKKVSKNTAKARWARPDVCAGAVSEVLSSS